MRVMVNLGLYSTLDLNRASIFHYFSVIFSCTILHYCDVGDVEQHMIKISIAHLYLSLVNTS